MVLTSGDLKRLLSVIRERARRAGTQLTKITKTASNKRFDQRTLSKVADALQSAYGQMKEIEETLVEMVD